jgi:hypothetical protein
MDTAKENVQSIGDKISNIKLPDTSELTEKATSGIENITSGISSVKDNLTNTLSEFSSPTSVNSSESFLTSNGLIAKLVFLLLVVIIFLFLMNLGISIINYFTQPTKNPYVLSGLAPGNSNITVPQDPSNPDSVTILRSNNQKTGLECTWSVWLLVSDLNKLKKSGASPPQSYSHIFNKGNNVFNPDTGIATVNNAPGLYIGDGSSNVLRVYMDTIQSGDYDVSDTFTEISNFPLKKWVHVAIRIENTIMDIYVNGTISGRKKFSNIPKQNYEDIQIGHNSGFNGQISDLIYYSKALGVFEINNIILKGPNLTQSSAIKSNIGFYTYLSSIWYSSK